MADDGNNKVFDMRGAPIDPDLTQDAEACVLQADPMVVEIFEQMLDEAKQGKITGFAGVTNQADTGQAATWAFGLTGGDQTVGALDRLKFQIMVQHMLNLGLLMPGPNASPPE